MSSKYENETIDYDKVVADLDQVAEDMNKMKIVYFINNAVLNVQASFNAQVTDVKSGMIKFVANVEMLEAICLAKELLKKDYHEAIEKYKKTPEYEAYKKDLLMGIGFTVAEYKLSMYKFQMIMNSVANKETIAQPLKI